MFIEKASHFCLVIFSLVMAFTVTSCVYLSLSQLKVIGFVLPAKGIVAGLVTAALLVLVAIFRNRIAAIFQKLELVPYLFGFALALGIVIRIAWWWLSLPEVQVIDGSMYLNLANRLYEGQDYAHPFWPPGTPLIYAAFLFVLGQHGWLALAINLVFFVLCGVSIRTILARLGVAPWCAGLSVALLAIWPELFFTAGQVSKETLLLGLLSGAFALLLSVGSGWTAVAAGLVSGLAVLTQPALVFLPLLFGLGVLATGYPWTQTLFRLFAMLIGMAVLIAPWTYRNYKIFGEFVLVSTNSGFVLHGGNQPAMVRPMEEVGGFIKPPVPEQPFKDELAASRWHTAEAFKFIKENPADFAVLVAHRLIFTMGDDSDNAYRSLRLTKKASGKVYLAAKVLCNGYWLLLTAMLCVFCWNFRDRESLRRVAPVAVVTALATLYLMGVHGMAEGGARHHMSWAWIYATLLAIILQRRTYGAGLTGNAQ